MVQKKERTRAGDHLQALSRIIDIYYTFFTTQYSEFTTVQCARLRKGGEPRRPGIMGASGGMFVA